MGIWRGAGRHGLLIAASVAAMGPVVWILSISLMTRREFAAEPFSLFRFLSLDNYLTLIQDPAMLGFLRNSLVVTVASVVIVVTCASLAAFALARIRFRGSVIAYAVFLGAQAMPILVLIVPLFVLVSRIGIGDSLLAVILPYAAMNMGLSVFLLRGFFRTIPSDLEDAARIDGCSWLQVIRHVMAPLIRPGIVVAALLNVIATWNEYFLAAILLPRRDLFTLPAGIAVEFSARYATNWPIVAAGVLLSAVPTIVLFIAAQDRIIEGWSRSVK